MTRQKLYTIAVLAMLAAILVGNVFRYYTGVHRAVAPDSTEEISILIHQGDSVREIGDALEEKKVIESGWAFYWYARLHDLDNNIISGRFNLSPSMKVPEILDKISDPAESEAVITIQEGLRIHDIDDRLTDMELITAGDFEKVIKAFNGYEYYRFLDPNVLKPLDLPLEGYLYPDTYFLDPIEFDPNDLIYKALDNFENKIAQQNMLSADYSFHEILTMASIIEKEVINTEDRKLVSGILWKRLESGWKLDADATLLYKKNDNKLTSADLASDSPYNTRKVKGLPPGPIGNPSINSIEAVLTPTSSDYWFYLTSKEGETIYANSNEEHNANKAKYL